MVDQKQVDAFTGEFKKEFQTVEAVVLVNPMIKWTVGCALLVIFAFFIMTVL